MVDISEGLNFRSFANSQVCDYLFYVLRRGETDVEKLEILVIGSILNYF